MKRGLFIVIEGTDGSGKTTQTKLLIKRLKRVGHRVAQMDFPQYGGPSAYYVEKYLRGEYGGADALGAQLPSIFFALDRFDAKEKIEKLLKKGIMVVSNRYIGSNLGHQGGKIRNKEKQKEYMWWDYALEYHSAKIPKPDLNILLLVPPEASYKFIAMKHARRYLRGKKRDIHEQDRRHLKRAYEAYTMVAKLFADDFETINCVRNKKLMTIPEVHEIIVDILRKRFKLSIP